MWKDVASQIGTGATNVANWSKGRTAPGLTFWPRIIEFLEYDPRPRATTIADALVRHREGQGLSQKQLAMQLRIDPSTLAKWERKERVPTGQLRGRVDRLLRP
jgi:DNA-binding transcriptional regulator YiaG